MKIIKLTLIGYKRLMLNNIKEFIYTPTNAYQIILGRNGCGKSSILDELSPLPASPSSYAKGGSKTIELEHGGSHYILESNFKGTNKHSFIRDGGEELNPGGTASVQKELVRQHFNLTPEIHRLMTGRVRFTQMTAAKRREWITALSDTDLTYAIKVYNKLKTSARDAQGAFKHVSSRITNETNKLVNIEDASELESRAQAIRDELTLLMENKTPLNGRYNQVFNELEHKLTELESISRTILKITVKPPKGFNFKSVQDIDLALSELKSNYSVSSALLEKASIEYGELERLLATIDQYSAGNIQELEQRRQQIDQRIDEILTSIKTFKVVNAAEKINDCTEALPAIREIMFEIPHNEENLYNNQSFNIAKEQSTRLTVECDRLFNRALRIRSSIEHLLEAKETNCPKCGHTWKPGFSEGDLERLELDLKNVERARLQSANELEEINDYLEKGRQWLEHYRRFSTLAVNYPRLSILWEHLVETKALLHNPRSHIAIIDTFEHDFKLCCELDQLSDENLKLEDVIECANKSEDSLHLQNRFKGLEDELLLRTNELEIIRASANEVNDYYKQIQRLLQLDQRAHELAEEIDSRKDLLIKILRNDEISNVINHQQSTLAIVQQKLNEKNTLEGILEDLKHHGSRLGDEHEALKTLVEALSPNEGLIAEQLTGFIKCFVDQMNDVINQIWTHDLFVLPCAIESGDLDYKFPLQVRTPTNHVPDVSEASVGQMEIIDFSFKLVAMLYMDFGNYPLFLDELGSNCDEQHRVNIVNYVKMIVDARRYSSVFYISHFAASHGALSGAEVLVVDAANITVPLKHNQHVVMK